MKLILILLVICTLGACTNQSDAKKALESYGFTDINYTGYKLFACSQEDFYHTGFTAMNQKKLPVSGTVCSGLFFKNSTVRF